MTNNDGEALEGMERQDDIGAITKLEFKTYQKVEIFKGRLHYLGEKIRMHQDDLYQHTFISVGGGVAFTVSQPVFGVAGTGIAVLTAIFSYVNRRRVNKCEKEFQRNKNELDRLEKGQLYQSLETKIYD